MGSEIKETDIVLALEQCWHGLERIVEFISPKRIDKFHKDAYFLIKEGGAFADIQPERRQELLTECQTQGYLSAQRVDELLSTFAAAPIAAPLAKRAATGAISSSVSSFAS